MAMETDSVFLCVKEYALFRRRLFFAVTREKNVRSPRRTAAKIVKQTSPRATLKTTEVINRSYKRKARNPTEECIVHAAIIVNF